MLNFYSLVLYINLLGDLFLTQNLLIITLIFFTTTYNIITLWYFAGIYLVMLGVLLLLNEGDILVGFLWVIDLGVGLVFFIFIMHYSTFLHQKVYVQKTSRELTFIFSGFLFLASFFYFFSNPVNSLNSNCLTKAWSFFIGWYDYYDFYFSYTITDLHMLREVYFYNNGFEFFLINFMLLYGIISSILLCFLLKRVFSFLNLSQYTNLNPLLLINRVFFIRNQNFIKQQSTSTGTRVWLKNKKDNI